MMHWWLLTIITLINTHYDALMPAHYDALMTLLISCIRWLLTMMHWWLLTMMHWWLDHFGRLMTSTSGAVACYRCVVLLFLCVGYFGRHGALVTAVLLPCYHSTLVVTADYDALMIVTMMHWWLERTMMHWCWSYDHDDDYSLWCIDDYSLWCIDAPGHYDACLLPLMTHW
jgi:hypothetical protein